MRDHSPSGFRWLMSAPASVALLGCLASCGGSGLGDASSHSPSQSYAYVASAAAQSSEVPGVIYQYRVGSDGSLTPLDPGSIATGVGPTALASDPTGHYVYVANSGDATISQYAVGAQGELAALSPAVLGIGGPFPRAGYSLSIDPQGPFLYVVIYPIDPPGPVAAIAQFSIGSDGTLAPLSPAFVSVPALVAGPLVVDSQGLHAYLAGNGTSGSAVFQFSIGADGTLAPLEPQSVAAAQYSIAVTLDATGQTAYVLSVCVDTACNGQAAQYAIGVNGALSSTGTVTLTGGHVNPVEMLISGSSAYLLTNFMGVDTNTGAIYQYAIDSSGALAADTPSSVSVASGSVAEAIEGTNLYALSSNAIGLVSGSASGGYINHYALGSGGELTAVSSTPLAAGLPTSMIFVTN